MKIHAEDWPYISTRLKRFRLMTVNRKSLWREQAVEISVQHKGSGHRSRVWKVSMEDAQNEVTMCNVVATLAEELEDEEAIYSKLESKT
jgi:hypothetical protein